jgi:hypothetical protein
MSHPLSSKALKLLSERIPLRGANLLLWTSVCFLSEAVVTAQSNDAPCQLRNSLCHAIIEANGSIWNHGHDH